jgi:ABC-type dipeptide/oligopeptide/nickel transport system permease component
MVFSAFSQEESMGCFILMLLAGMIPALLILSMITFALMHEVPGGLWKVGQRFLSNDQHAAFDACGDLDKPAWQQYLAWLGGVLRLNFGMSFEHPDESVIGTIARTWPTKLHLALLMKDLSVSWVIPNGRVKNI